MYIYYTYILFICAAVYDMLCFVYCKLYHVCYIDIIWYVYTVIYMSFISFIIVCMLVPPYSMPPLAAVYSCVYAPILQQLKCIIYLIFFYTFLVYLIEFFFYSQALYLYAKVPLGFSIQTLFLALLFDSQYSVG